MSSAQMDKATLEQLLDGMQRAGASTLLLVPDTPPLMRVQGVLVPNDGPPLLAADTHALCRELLFEDQWHELDCGREVDVLFTGRDGRRFRTAAMREQRGLSLVFRRVPESVPGFDELGLPELLGSFVEFQSGIVIVTGFLGSGKSTTLASMVDRMSAHAADHIVLVEKPIEYLYTPRSSLLHQREVGVHVDSFARGVEDAVRHGADVVVVGDLDSYETLMQALVAAEQGLLVLTTLHASSVVGGLFELVSMCPVDERARVRVRLAATLRAMVSQTLIRRSQTKGRVPLLEIMINNQAVRQHVRAGTFQELPKVMERSRGLGMQTVDLGLRALLSRNLISIDEALFHATNRQMFSGSGSGRRPALAR